MTTLAAAVAAARYGYGLGPDPAPQGAEDVLGQLAAADLSPAGPDIVERLEMMRTLVRTRRMVRESGNDIGAEEASERVKAASRHVTRQRGADIRALIGRAIETPTPFAERLVHFWTDHFTVEWRSLRTAINAAHMIDAVIRPNVAGRFPEMLKGVTRHPAMLGYLNQAASVGPNSVAGQRRSRGLNENLAREILELHTLGVDSGYTQGDVREFAELLTGYGVGPEGFRFMPRRAEPGAETVLGVAYGGRRGQMADVEAALDDLAMRPETAAHLSRKLLIHFLGHADPAVEADMAAAYLAADGALVPLYERLLAAPGAFDLPLRKAKMPMEFVVSVARALGPAWRAVLPMARRGLAENYIGPMLAMGQSFMRPGAPAGWDEDPGAWITPSGLAARIEWARRVGEPIAERFEPTEWRDRALGPLADDRLRFAVDGAETRAEAITLVLASPAFNRR